MYDEAIQLTQASSDDVDDQASMLKGWDQSYTQLEAGRFEARVQAFLTQGSGVFRKTTNRKLYKIFAPPAGSFAIAVQLARSGLTLFQGQPTGAGDVLVLPGDRQFELICQGSFDVIVAVFPRADLASLLGEGNPPGAEARIIKGASGTRMGLWLASALSEIVASDCSGQSVPAIQFRNEFVRRCSGLLDETGNQLSHWRNSQRRSASRIFDEAKAFIDSALGQEYVPTVLEISKSVRVSARTLEYAFDQVVAVSPSRYLQCLRLCCARRDLKNSREVSVTAIAMKWGFWHLGRFSIAYREMFGELPSQSFGSSRKPTLNMHFA